MASILHAPPCSGARRPGVCVLLPAVLTLGGLAQVAWGELALPALFSDHMVIQRDMPTPVWGRAEPDSTVSVRWRGQDHTTKADATGQWRVKLPPANAGGPEELVVSSEAQTIRVRDVMVGEVWLCSGQSNMAWTVRWSKDFDAEQKAATLPAIRMFKVPYHPSAQPQSDAVGRWVVCEPETVGTFSATGYFFGRELHRELNVPVGLLHSSVGGTRIEPWICREGFLGDPRFAARVNRLDREIAEYKAMGPAERKLDEALKRADYMDALLGYWQETDTVDPGMREEWASPSYDDGAWGAFPLTSSWEHAGIAELKTFDGSVWLRTTVDIPAAWAGHKLALSLPAIDDSDTTFFNGVQVGRTTWKWATPRRYEIPGKLVKPGAAVVAIQAIDYRAAGGFGGSESDIRARLKLEVGDGVEPATAPLAGSWRYRIAAPVDQLPTPPTEPEPYVHPGTKVTSPTALYNGMIAPLVPYAMRGAVWYQGESNASEPVEYRALLPLLIDSWRSAWSQPRPHREFPFGVVQLANFGPERPRDAAPGGWAWLRDAQLQTARTHPNTGLAVTIDIGEADDIHPKNKQDVGRRLALWALRTVYDRPIRHSGPIYRKAERRDDGLALHFDHAEGGLTTRDGRPLQGFAIAGEDRRFVWAEARIEGVTVVVNSPEVPHPVAVRYAWANNPATANLANKAGLPASPFRTDDWAE